MKKLVLVSILLISIMLGACTPVDSQDDLTQVRVLIPNDHNLQWMNFWIAQGAGFFEDEGLDITVITLPEHPLYPKALDRSMRPRTFP